MSNQGKKPDELEFNSIVGKNIRYLRKLKKLTQQEIADAVGVACQQVSKYEKGMNGCSAFRLHQLAKFFGVSMEVLADPQMITKHRGFAEEMEWQQYEADIERQLTEQEIIDKYKKSVGHYVNNKS